jgi:Mce-associated membrane protein
MEDQQPDPDDLTGDRPAGDTPSAAIEDAGGAAIAVRTRRRQRGQTPHGKRQRRRQTIEVDPGADADADRHDTRADVGTDIAAPDPDDQGEAVTGARWFTRWQTAMVGVAAVVFVGVVIFAGTALHTYLADRAAAATRTDVARTAVAAVTTLWTYTPDTVDTLADRAAQYLGGDFNAQYREFLDAAATPNKAAQVTDSTEVVGVGVESLNGSDAVAIVFTNTTATSPLTKNVPSLKYVGYRLAMTREGSRWLVTNMSTVSFMDLTPQI